MLTQKADTSVANTCLICDSENPLEASLCAFCYAPMTLGQDVSATEEQPQIVSVIGESNVGKTVYLGVLLDMLSQRAGDYEAIPQGAYSIDLQQTVISHLSHRMFPPKTPMEINQWYWVYYQIRRRAEGSPWIDLIMPDMAGESISAEVENPNTFRAINNLINKSKGLLLLVDAALAANGSTQPDFFALKMLSYIDRMNATRRSSRIQTPIALLLCKSDYCPECFDNPQDFVRANLNRTWNLCESRFENVNFFATSVVGSLGYAMCESGSSVIPIPLHTALRGVLEPFVWVIDQL